jgi:hypothetical protein
VVLYPLWSSTPSPQCPQWSLSHRTHGVHVAQGYNGPGDPVGTVVLCPLCPCAHCGPVPPVPPYPRWPGGPGGTVALPSPGHQGSGDQCPHSPALLGSVRSGGLDGVRLTVLWRPARPCWDSGGPALKINKK